MLLVAAWLILVGACVLLSRWSGRHIETCLFRAMTGIPCPTCGATRGCLSLLYGDLAGGWLYNPLLFTAAGLAATAILGRVLFGKTLRIELSRRGRAVAWTIAAAAWLFNWLYVILAVR